MSPRHGVNPSHTSLTHTNAHRRHCESERRGPEGEAEGRGGAKDAPPPPPGLPACSYAYPSAARHTLPAGPYPRSTYRRGHHAAVVTGPRRDRRHLGQLARGDCRRQAATDDHARPLPSDPPALGLQRGRVLVDNSLALSLCNIPPSELDSRFT